MFDIGFWELCMVAVVGLVVLGPDRLPMAVKTVAAWIRKAKALSRSITQEIEKELDIEDFRKELEEKNRTIKQQAQLLADQLNQPVESLTSLDGDLNETIANFQKNKVMDTSIVKNSPTQADADEIAAPDTSINTALQEMKSEERQL